MPTSYGDVAHLLRRAGYAPTGSEIQALTASDIPTIVESLLDLSGAPGVSTPIGMNDATLGNWEKWVSSTQWWLDRMRTTSKPLQEKMTFFWHNHFATSREKVDDMTLLWQQNQTMRANCLGNFRNLTLALSQQPALLLYLDNDSNEVGAPNENFARELMELFTLGVNQYSQADVVAAARAWTGYGIVGWNGTNVDYTYKFNAVAHDNGNKTFFGTTKNWDGPGVINEILSANLAKKLTAAKFIARKAWSWFAYPNPSAAIVDAVGTAFYNSDLDIKVLMRTIFNHSEFYSTTAKQGLLRTPVEFIVAMMRYMGISSADAHPEWYLEAMGMAPFTPPNVAGWKQNLYWVSSAAFWARADFATHMGWIATDSQNPKSNVFININNMGPAAAANDAFNTFGVNTPSMQTRTTLENWMADQRGGLYQDWVERPYMIRMIALTPEFQMA